MKISSRSFWSAVDAAVCADGRGGCWVAPDVGTTCEEAVVGIAAVVTSEDDGELLGGDGDCNGFITPCKYCGPPDIESFEPTLGVSSVVLVLLSSAAMRGIESAWVSETGEEAVSEETRSVKLLFYCSKSDAITSKR